MSKKQLQAGFTLIEMVIVVTISGFLVTAATSLMASFARFKYATDVQQQLRSEANFAAGQIDLLIRNSNGIADLCLLNPIANPVSSDGSPCVPSNCCASKICHGKPVYVYWQETLPSGSGVYYNQHSASCCPTARTTEYDYRKGGVGSKSAELNFITLQELSQRRTCTLNGIKPQLKEVADGGAICFVETSQTTYYNNTIRRVPVDRDFGQVSGGGDQQRLAVVREEYNPSAYTGTNANTNYLDDLNCIGRNCAGGCSLTVGSCPSMRNNYLTSNAVHVSDLIFSCQLKNHGMPNQAALITYTIKLEKPKRAMRLDFYNYEDLSGYETFTITRTVNLRNSGNPFNLPVDN
ncbi:type II secretion system GspH family protein [Microgenomates group bacterium]|nr:type II secretion system GspH family protein [Microgenomates group bacterium]